MAQYKVVPVSKNINIGHDGNTQDAIVQFQKEIETEASGGWEFVCTHTVSVTQEPEPIGCFGSLMVLLGMKQRPESSTYHIDLMIFTKP